MAAVRFGSEKFAIAPFGVSVLGVFGGTFDPVHIGHLRTAYELRAHLGLTEVRMVVSGSPPHRARPAAAAADRWRMLELALAGAPHCGLVADRRELDRAGPSYMVDTLEEMRAEAGEMPICLLLGTDAFAGLARWHRWTDIARLAHLVVVARPGDGEVYDGPLRALWDRRTDDPTRLREVPAGRVLTVTLTQLDVSATRIRRQIADGLGAEFLTPAPVVRYIETRRLYLGLVECNG